MHFAAAEEAAFRSCQDSRSSRLSSTPFRFVLQGLAKLAALFFSRGTRCQEEDSAVRIPWTLIRPWSEGWGGFDAGFRAKLSVRREILP